MIREPVMREPPQRPQRVAAPPPPPPEESMEWSEEPEPAPPPPPQRDRRPRARRPARRPGRGALARAGAATRAPASRAKRASRGASRARRARPQPAPTPAPAPTAEQFNSAADQNLAEMAQRLEAALRRPGKTEEPRFAEALARGAGARRRRDRRLSPPPPPPSRAPAAAEARPARGEPRPGRADGKAPAGKSLYDSLEQEMASLFGRPEQQTLRTPRIAHRVRLATVAAGVAVRPLRRLCRPAVAQDISINFGQGGGLTERVIQLIAFLTVLSLAPSILIMMTSFTRIVVVLSLLRTALGTATAPPNAVIVALALFLTAFVMGPALQRAYDVGIRPLMNNEISVEQAFERSSEPLKRVHAEERAREGPRAVHRPLARAAPGRRPRRCRCASWCRPS